MLKRDPFTGEILKEFKWRLSLSVSLSFSASRSLTDCILCPLCLQLLRRLWASEPGHVVPILLQAQQEAQGEFLLLPHPVQEFPECKRTDAG